MGKIGRENLEEVAEEIRTKESPANWIKVGMSTCGIAAGAEPVYKRFVEVLREREIDVPVFKTGCVGSCHAEPLVEICVEGAPRTMYGDVSLDAVARLVQEHVINRRVVPGLVVPGVGDLGFESENVPPTVARTRQQRVVLRNCGIIDPNNINDYIARGGYQALKKALFDLGPEGVIEQMRIAGLRGRGGAGYPTHLKWSLTRKTPSDEKYMICNGDEGDPGAYMDRSVLEGDPHSVVEGMIIAGYAIGATMGYFYIRAEYPLAIDRIENAIKQARRNGLVGKDVMGSGWSFDLEVRLGAGAFVCGEETALIASIEGKRGTPVPRPPYPAVKGLWGKPSNINNVETLANVAPIIARGGEWFASIGTEHSKGTKVFAVTGKVRNSGLVEIPMGTTLREIVFDICGGVPSGHRIKAVQTGGPSGGVIPEHLLDTPVSYESLSALGSIMGSGGMIVMDETDGMVDIAKFYVGFCVDESCGKCAPCRIGGKQMFLLLDKISQGAGSADDIAALRRISHAMQKASLCGLGQTAPNPVLSTLHYFENEYTATVH